MVNSYYPLLREAKVISVDDPEKLGRVQLKVYPELSEIKDDECPWCFPTHGGIHGKSFEVPLVDTLVTCIVWNKYWNEISFFPLVITKPTEHLFDKWKDNQKSKISDMKDAPEEAHLSVEQYEDDFNEFHDTKNSQHGVLHPSGAYCLIDKDGTMYIQFVKKYVFHDKDSNLKIEIDSSDGSIKLETKGEIKETIKKDWSLSVDGNAEIKVKGNAKIEATGNVDTKGTNVTVEASGMLTLKSGDAGAWCPNAITVCPLGVPHGGKAMGIIKLTGA